MANRVPARTVKRDIYTHIGHRPWTVLSLIYSAVVRVSEKSPVFG
ncbi:MAG: hypothetical protein ACFFE4_18435 [Candidatus Thorarchaeota archaeon]